MIYREAIARAASNPQPPDQPYDGTSATERSIVPVRSEYELLTLAVETFMILGLPEPFERAKQRVDHELEHAAAATQIGAAILGYGVRFEQVAHSRFGSAPHFYTAINYPANVAPLHQAAVLLHPRDPSPHDRAKALELGYDVRTLALEALTANRKTGALHIPVPLSYHAQ